MRYLLLLLVPSFAFAEGRIAAYVVGGLEGGTITREPRPDGVAEAGVSAELMLPGRRWGFGVVYDRVARLTEGEPIDAEHKLDVMVRFRNETKRFHGGVGFGVRSLEIEGKGFDRPASTVRGYDLLRVDMDMRIVHVGPMSLDFCFHWTFGLYSGEAYRERFGDMPYQKRDVSAMTTSYVLGLQTSFGWK